MKTHRTANSENSVKVLNRLFGMLDCSLARNLSYARPWVRRRYLLLDAVARRISYEHELFAGNLARLIYDRRGSLHSGVFPMEYTSYNDVSLEYLAPRLLEQQHTLTAAAEHAVEQLDDDPDARRVVSRIATSLQRYAALLAELLAPCRVAPPPTSESGTTSLHDRPPSPVRLKRSAQLESQTAA
jgi:hypothetical protein